MARERKAVYEFGPFRLDAQEQALSRDGEALRLTPKALETLLALVENAGHLVEKEELMKRLWPDAFVEDGNLTFNIAVLRRALGDTSSVHQYIETVPKRGYRFIAPVTIVGAEDIPLISHERGAIREPPVQPRILGLVSPSAVALAAIASVVLGVLAYWLTRPLPAPRVLGYTQLTNDGLLKGGNLLTDGVRLYFTEARSAGIAIVQIPTSGGEPALLSTFFRSPRLQDLNRNRAEVLVADPIGPPGVGPTLWVLPLAGGQPRRVGNVLADAAAWSPDGNSIIYATGAELYSCRSDGSESRRIAILSGKCDWIRAAPDGRRLSLQVFSYAKGVEELWEMQADGSNLHQMFVGLRSVDSHSGGQWAVRGDYFFFASSRNDQSELWVAQEVRASFTLQRAPPTRLTTVPLLIRGFVPSTEAGSVFVIEEQYRGQILRLDPGSKQFVIALPGVPADEVDFSPDGKWVAYVSIPGNRLWRRRWDGSQPLQLALPPMTAELPRWSPDGKWIAFMGRKGPSEVWQVFLVPAEGGEYRPVLPAPFPQGAPTWSADGKRLAFGELLSVGGIDRPPSQLAIHVVNVETHEATTLPGSRGLFTARWSPDGRMVAALTAGSKNLMVFDSQTQRWKKVASAGSISDLNWSRKGAEIYLQDILSPNGPAIFRVRIQDRRVDEIASLKGKPPIYSRWIGVAPDDSVLVSNTLSSSEIYALEWEAP